jgi:hypothetical protein
MSANDSSTWCIGKVFNGTISVTITNGYVCITQYDMILCKLFTLSKI